MSILNTIGNTIRDGATNFSSDVMGMKNAIKNFVEAKKASAKPEDKGSKKTILKGAIKKSK